MILLFKRNRQRSATELKMSKYFFYAVGEIVLVVIGILIAVQVNSWRESKVEQKWEKTYIESYKKDLILDISELERSIYIMDGDLQSLLRLSYRISSEAATIDTLISVFRNELNVYFNPANSVNSKTFERINSTGNLDLMDPWLRDAMIEHNSKQLHILKIVDDNSNLYLQTMSRMGGMYPLKPKFDAFGKPLFIKRNGAMDIKFWNSIDQPKFIGDLNGLLNSKIQMENNVIGVRKMLLEDTKVLLKKVTAAYSKD
ncbi:MAG: DUF6090 family protein [Allomuricauda sp.]